MLNYIPLPSNLHSTSEVLPLMVHEGAHGYGILLLLMQLARDAEGRMLSNDCELLAYAIHEQDVELVKRVVQNYNLFPLVSDSKLYCTVLENLMKGYDSKKEAAREAGKRGAAKRYAATTLQQTDSHPTTTLQQTDSHPTTTPQQTDSHPTTTPQQTDSYITQFNNTERKITQSRSKLQNEQFCGISGEGLISLCRDKGQLISDDYIKALRDSAPEGHTPYFLAEIARDFGVSRAVFDLLAKWTHNAQCDYAPYIFIIKLRNEAKKANFAPKYPNEYVMSKCIEFQKQTSCKY